MGIVLGPNNYGKAETRVVRIYRDTARHEIRDLSVTTSLRGDFAAAHIAGDQSSTLPTDSQKNAVFAFAKQVGVQQIEDYALALATHFVDDVGPVHGSRVEVKEYAWQRIGIDGKGHDHSFVRTGQDVRTTAVAVDGVGTEQTAVVESGLADLVVLKSTGSEFAGFLRDRYTTLADTHDRVMATSLTARWAYTGTGVDWGASYDAIRQTLLEMYATVHSLALQQTLYEMGKAVLERQPAVAEITLTAPNIHHFAVDLEPFGLENPGEVFYVADRPYGLIEATVRREADPT